MDYEIGTVGIPLPGLQVKIDKNGEILVKGPTVTPGYYKNDKANEEAFTADGFFRTLTTQGISPKTGRSS